MLSRFVLNISFLFCMIHYYPCQSGTGEEFLCHSTSLSLCALCLSYVYELMVHSLCSVLIDISILSALFFCLSNRIGCFYFSWVKDMPLPVSFCFSFFILLSFPGDSKFSREVVFSFLNDLFCLSVLYSFHDSFFVCSSACVGLCRLMILLRILSVLLSAAWK